MSMMRVFALLCAAAMPVLHAGAARTELSEQAIRMVTTAPGGGNDLTARIIAQGLTAIFGQQVVVDNRSSTVVPATSSPSRRLTVTC